MIIHQGEATVSLWFVMDTVEIFSEENFYYAGVPLIHGKENISASWS